jgi:hypothetical protein
MKRILFLLPLVLTALPAFPQLRVEAELRPRILVENGYGSPKTLESPSMGYITQRTRLNLDFRQGLFETYVSVQDVRFWGGDNNYRASGTYGQSGSISLHQGWFLVKPTPWLSLKAGRQLFSYDDQRILSSRNWNDYQVTYDALLVKADHNGHRVDLGLSWNSESSGIFYLPQQKFKTMDFLRYERKTERITWSAIALVTGNTLSDTIDRVWVRATWGTNFNFSTPGFRFRSSLYYQHHLNSYGGMVSAWSGSFRAGVPIFRDRLTGSAGLDYVSGQDETMGDGYALTSHSFDLFYGKRHGWYGYMDYFNNMPAQGLQDYVIQAEYTPAPGWTFQADYHLFWLAARKADPDLPGESLSKRLGDELDLTLLWKINEQAEIQAGYSFFLTRPTLEDIKGLEGEALKFPQFVYLMITIKPSFTFGASSEPAH